MIELVILVLFIVLITGVILVYKKYVNVVNVINDEQNRKYKEISELVGSNNENIKNNKKNAEEILDRDTVDVQILQEIINNNNNNVKTNQNNLNKYNFEDLNKIFSYDNGFIIGNSSSQINIGDNNIRLNVENPSKIRVCNEQNECTGSNSFATLQSVLNNYPLLENDSQAQTGLTQNGQNAQTGQNGQNAQTGQNGQTGLTQNGQNSQNGQTTSNNKVFATNVTTSSPEPDIYFSKISNTLYSNIGIKDIIINIDITAGSGFYILEEEHINIASDKIENLSKFKSSNELITIYIPEDSSSTEHTGEIFSIDKNSFPEINTLILYINKIYETDSYEYILNL